MTLRLPPNTMKRVYFTPRYYRSRGSLQKYTQNESGTSASPSGNPKRVTSELLVKVGKFIDGVYELGDA